MSDAPLKIRIGTPDDVHDCMELATLATAENGFVAFNAVKVLSEIWPALNQDFGIVGLIGPEGEKHQGAILLRIQYPWYSDQLVLEERGIFIHPYFRSAKGGRAARLCEFSKRAATSLGLPLLIGVLSNHRTEAKNRLYRRVFGEPAGTFYLFNASTGGAVTGELTG